MTIPRRHQPLSVGALQHPERSRLDLGHGLTFAPGPTVGGIFSITVGGETVTFRLESTDTPSTWDRKVRAALRRVP